MHLLHTLHSKEDGMSLTFSILHVHEAMKAIRVHQYCHLYGIQPDTRIGLDLWKCPFAFWQCVGQKEREDQKSAASAAPIFDA